jgi:hypothetical protein
MEEPINLDSFLELDPDDFRDLLDIFPELIHAKSMFKHMGLIHLAAFMNKPEHLRILLEYGIGVLH